MTWLLIGTVFYTYNLDLTWSKGFYMAINVGYSIGWGYPSEVSYQTRIFSIFYILVGASAVAASLSFFAKSVIKSSKDWYSNALYQEQYKHSSNFEKYTLWAKLHETSLKFIAIWPLWILTLMTFSLLTVKWDWTQAIYFAISSLSTGGLWPIPKDSPDWYFAFGEYVSIFEFF